MVVLILHWHPFFSSTYTCFRQLFVFSVNFRDCLNIIFKLYSTICSTLLHMLSTIVSSLSISGSFNSLWNTSKSGSDRSRKDFDRQPSQSTSVQSRDRSGSRRESRTRRRNFQTVSVGSWHDGTDVGWRGYFQSFSTFHYIFSPINYSLLFLSATFISLTLMQ